MCVAERGSNGRGGAAGPGMSMPKCPVGARCLECMGRLRRTAGREPPRASVRCPMRPRGRARAAPLRPYLHA